MSRQISASVSQEMLDKVEKILAERRKHDPMVTRADVLRELIDAGLSAKPLAISLIGKPRA